MGSPMKVQILRRPPNICSVRLSVRTVAFHAAKRGSIPLQSTILKHILKSRGTFLKVNVNPAEGVIIGIVARENRGSVCFNMVSLNPTEDKRSQ